MANNRFASRLTIQRYSILSVREDNRCLGREKRRIEAVIPNSPWMTQSKESFTIVLKDDCKRHFYLPGNEKTVIPGGTGGLYE